MFEIFCLGKLNIFSSKDAGLRLAMNNYGMINAESDWENYDQYAKKGGHHTKLLLQFIYGKQLIKKIFFEN